MFLCAGAIETPRLLLLNGLGNASGQVGRNFMAHTGGQLWGRFDEEVRPHKGIPGSLISEDTHRPTGNPGFVGGYLLQSIGVMPVTYVQQLTRGEGLFGEETTRAMVERARRTLGERVTALLGDERYRYLSLVGGLGLAPDAADQLRGAARRVDDLRYQASQTGRDAASGETL